VSRFCAENQLSGKFREKSPKILFYPRTSGARWGHLAEPGGGLTTPRRGWTLAAPTGGETSPDIFSAPLRLVFNPFDLKTEGGRSEFAEEFRCAAATRNSETEIRTPFWHPAGTGNRRRSSPSSSPPPLHQPSMTPPSMCE